VSPLLNFMLHQQFMSELDRQVQNKSITIEQAVAAARKIAPSLDAASAILDAMPKIDCDYDDDDSDYVASQKADAYQEQTEENLYTTIRAGKWATPNTDIMFAWTARAIIHSLSAIPDRSDYSIGYELRTVLEKVNEQTQ